MAYQQLYALEFKNMFDHTCLLEIWKETEDPPIEVEFLTGSSTPVVLRGINNDRSLYTAIRGQELTVEIVTNSLSIATFVADDETTWKGIFKVNDTTVFEGFLLQEDSDEEFIDMLHKIKLRFTDSLALLKGVEFRDNNGNFWFATPTVYDIVKTCLRKTGLQLDLDILCDIFPSDTADVTLTSTFSITKVNTRTFMSNQRDFMDCYEVLERVMTAFGCTLYQYGGRWVIDRWADRLVQQTSRFRYDVNDEATLLGTSHPEAAIGLERDIKEVEVALLVSNQRTAADNRVNFNFDQWPELIRNLDLDEGTVNFLLSGPLQRTYSLDNYTLVGRTAYSRREIDTLGNETQRYLYIDGSADNLDLTKYVATESFPAKKDDRIRFSFAASTKNDLPGTQAQAFVKCGSYYLDDDGKWKTGAVTLRLDFASAEDTREWKTYDITSEGIPADGQLEIRFISFAGCAVGNESRYKDLTLEYVKVFNNSAQAIGDYNSYPNPVTKKNPVITQVHLSDSLRYVIKGALLKNNGTLETAWQRGSNSEELRFSQLNALGYYQSTYRSKVKVDGTFRGLYAGTDPVGIGRQFTIDDLPNKKFAVTSLEEVDWYSGIWKANFVEVHDTVLDAAIETPPAGYVYNFIMK